ncbi:hypothetical protein C1H46_001251 [Malus baccata]|uniref:Uncharacterized protein n=1 Tax=Malus baccata TaxID=106549 RepID=A0A540NQ47_MALBA|nr:hypothetical protein C1H46_001251 [Malus baccata]
MLLLASYNGGYHAQSNFNAGQSSYDNGGYNGYICGQSSHGKDVSGYNDAYRNFQSKNSGKGRFRYNNGERFNTYSIFRKTGQTSLN